MSATNRQHLLAEKGFLTRQLQALPLSALLTRKSTEARIKSVDSELARIPESARDPARARLTFGGAPVVGTHGIIAEFGARAVTLFTEAVAAMAASQLAPLMSMGPIPNRNQNQLLITNTALGSFGFELEEYCGNQQSLADESPVAVALAKTQEFLLSTLGTDEELADAASETDQRAQDKIRAFLRALSDSEAFCSLQYGNHVVRFTLGQVKESVNRLSSENFRTELKILEGSFVGLLPNSRTFEFKVAPSEGQLIRGKIPVAIENPDEINKNLYQRVNIEVIATQVGSGRPRYTLSKMPNWNFQGHM